MAKIHEEFVIVKISKLIKNHEDTAEILTEELTEAVAAVLESTLGEVVGSDVIIEVEKGA